MYWGFRWEREIRKIPNENIFSWQNKWRTILLVCVTIAKSTIFYSIIHPPTRPHIRNTKHMNAVEHTQCVILSIETFHFGSNVVCSSCKWHTICGLLSTVTVSHLPIQYWPENFLNSLSIVWMLCNTKLHSNLNNVRDACSGLEFYLSNMPYWQ